MSAKAMLAACLGYGAGIWFFILAVKKRALLERAKRWWSTTGCILESTVYRDAERNANHFRVRYEYHVGQRFEGATPRIAGDWFWNDRQQAAFVARYTAGQQVEVFYDPRDPRQSCLNRTDTSGIDILWLISVGGFFLGTVIMLLDGA
jgi:hypothetical protein